MLASVAVCCGVLNQFLLTQRAWSLYVIGAAIMLWIWTVPPLLHHRKDTFRLQLLADVLAIAVYVSLIAVDLDGWDWYLHLALPIILWLGALFLFWGLTMGPPPPEHPVLHGPGHRLPWGCSPWGWRPLWTSISRGAGPLGGPSSWWRCASCCSSPLIVVRRVPSLREEVRRRFHM